MKARIKTKKEIGRQLQREEILRIFKLWLFSLNQIYGFGAKRLNRILSEVNAQAAEAYETPELWYYIDEIIIDKYQFGDKFNREDLDEREDTSKQIHKENGRKWRCY